jgi:hypothetical protein
MKEYVTMIDLPSGWKYGFPKVTPSKFETFTNEQRKEWMISEGYPEKELDYYGDNLWYRCWKEEVEIPPHTD